MRTTGHFSFPFARAVGRKGTGHAVDISRTVLENVNKRMYQENIENVKTVWSDLEVYNATKISSNSLDLALLINTLYLSTKRMEIIREAVRL